MEQKKYVQKNEMTAFCVAGLGQGMIYALMSSYISDYYLNVLQLTPMFVLLLMLLARVWDAINDPLMYSKLFFMKRRCAACQHSTNW